MVGAGSIGLYTVLCKTNKRVNFSECLKIAHVTAASRAKSTLTNYQLEQVQVVFRHGARTTYANQLDYATLAKQPYVWDMDYFSQDLNHTIVDYSICNLEGTPFPESDIDKAANHDRPLHVGAAFIWKLGIFSFVTFH